MGTDLAVSRRDIPPLAKYRGSLEVYQKSMYDILCVYSAKP